MAAAAPFDALMFDVVCHWCGQDGSIQDGRPSGHTGPHGPPDPRIAGPTAWLRNIGASRTGFRRRAAAQHGHALSGADAVGAARSHPWKVGRDRDEAQSAFLWAYGSRPASARKGKTGVGADGGH